MSAVTASIIVGTKHRCDPGIQPRWLLMLHEGQSYAWHLLKLQLTLGDMATIGAGDPPGILWRAGSEEDLLGEMALLLHLYAARTPDIVRAATHLESLRKTRIDLGGLPAREVEEFAALREMALDRGREMTLAVTILPGSRLTEDALFELPDWELNIAHTAVTRDWAASEHGLVVTDYREPAPEIAEADAFEDDALAAYDDHEPFEDEAARAAWERDEEARRWAAANAARRPATGLATGPPTGRAARPDADQAAAHATEEADTPGEEPGLTMPPEQPVAATPPGRGRFGLRRHKPVISTVERQRVGLAELFGRTD